MEIRRWLEELLAGACDGTACLSLETLFCGRFFMTFDRYSRPIAMSDPGRHATLFDGLSRDPAALAKVVQGLIIHQYIAPAYGVTLSRDQQVQSHVRAVEKILDDIVMRDGRSLSISREASERQVGVCRHFTLLHLTMLRTQGIPARAPAAASVTISKRNSAALDHAIEVAAPSFHARRDKNSTADSARTIAGTKLSSSAKTGATWRMARTFGVCTNENAQRQLKVAQHWSRIQNILAIGGASPVPPADVWNGQRKSSASTIVLNLHSSVTAPSVALPAASSVLT
jgi:hypothetical protein